MKQLNVPVHLLSVLIPGMEQAIRAAVDELNRVCHAVGTPGYALEKSDAMALPRAESGRMNYSAEEKAELVREYDALPAGGARKQWLEQKNLSYQIVFGWRSQKAVVQFLGNNGLTTMPAPSTSAAPQWKKGARRVWTDEQKAEFIRQYDALPHGHSDRGALMKRNHVNWRNLHVWKRQLGMKNGKKPAKRQQAEVDQGATTEQMKQWARSHDGIFDVNAFHKQHPELHVKGLGMQVRLGTFRKVGERQFKLKES